MTLLLSAAFLAGGAQVSFAVLDPTGQSAAGTTGAQQATSCPTPRLSGLPKRQKFTNATIHFKLTNMTPGASYVIMAGLSEVLDGNATKSTVKGSFLLPDQGTKDKKIMIKYVIDLDQCANAPWKLQKRIGYKSTTQTTPTAPPTKPPVSVPAAGKPPLVTPTKPIKLPKPLKPIQLPKLPKPITQRLPDPGPPSSRRTWLTPIDGDARLDQKLTEPVLGRLERKADKANSSNALLGLGIVAGIFAMAVVGGFMLFRRRDDILFERAQTEQLKHLEEGDPGADFAEDPEAPLAPVEQAPFASEAETAATAPVSATVHTNGAPVEQPAVSDADLTQHRAEVEAQLQRILNEAGLEAELEGILGDARLEAERNGITLDPELMLNALCEQINGSTRLSDPNRAELRSMFAEIIAEETQQVPAEDEKVPTQ